MVEASNHDLETSKEKQCSAYGRQQKLVEMSTQPLDLLVIGGGITGCGIALDAIKRGLRVGLVEMQDFGAGTSSRSTKLIHGGLRYLKQLEFRLVREVGRERAILHRNAPHTVAPEWMLLPLIQGGTFGRLATSLGLWLYDWLAGVKKEERRRMLNKQATLQREPLLKEEGLKGGGYYVEYRTDDARLTIEVLKTAVHLGALAVNYAKVTKLVYDQHKITGAVAQDQIEGNEYTIHAKKIVNAGGPWVDTVRELDGSLRGKRLHVTKGVHLVIDQSRFPLQQAIYFDVHDGRMIFAIPRDGKTYIGTTDTNYQGDYVEPNITEEDIHYLLNACNNMFPAIKLERKDVDSYWVGLRPLIHEDGKAPSELSRKDEIILSESGLITIAGGKLTGFRKMAERVVDVVINHLAQEEQRMFTHSQTDTQVLSGGEVDGPENWPTYREKKVVELQKKELSEYEAQTIVQRYGSNVDQVISYLPEAEQYRLQYHLPLGTIAELLYCMHHEMTVTADDFLIRRISAKYFDHVFYSQYKAEVERFISSHSIEKC